jgi:hypothetical protein
VQWQFLRVCSYLAGNLLRTVNEPSLWLLWATYGPATVAFSSSSVRTFNKKQEARRESRLWLFSTAMRDVLQRPFKNLSITPASRGNTRQSGIGAA